MTLKNFNNANYLLVMKGTTSCDGPTNERGRSGHCEFNYRRHGICPAECLSCLKVIYRPAVWPVKILYFSSKYERKHFSSVSQLNCGDSRRRRQKFLNGKLSADLAFR